MKKMIIKSCTTLCFATASFSMEDGQMPQVEIGRKIRKVTQPEVYTVDVSKDVLNLTPLDPENFKMLKENDNSEGALKLQGFATYGQYFDNYEQEVEKYHFPFLASMKAEISLFNKPTFYATKRRTAEKFYWSDNFDNYSAYIKAYKSQFYDQADV